MITLAAAASHAPSITSNGIRNDAANGVHATTFRTTAEVSLTVALVEALVHMPHMLRAAKRSTVQPLCSMGFHCTLEKMAWKEIGT